MSMECEMFTKKSEEHPDPNYEDYGIIADRGGDGYQYSYSDGDMYECDGVHDTNTYLNEEPPKYQYEIDVHSSSDKMDISKDNEFIFSATPLKEAKSQLASDDEIAVLFLTESYLSKLMENAMKKKAKKDAALNNNEDLTKQLKELTLYEDMCKLWARIYEKDIANNESKERTITIFDSVDIPPISILDYIKRFMYSGYLDEPNITAIYVFILIERLYNYENLHITKYNFHRLFSAVVVISCKFLNDITYKNKVYAKISGLSLEELNKLERYVLYLLKFDMYINPDEYKKYETMFTLRLINLHNE